MYARCMQEVCTQIEWEPQKMLFGIRRWWPQIPMRGCGRARNTGGEGKDSLMKVDVVLQHFCGVQLVLQKRINIARALIIQAG